MAQLSAYELQQLANIARNNAVLQDLGLVAPATPQAEQQAICTSAIQSPVVDPISARTRLGTQAVSARTRSNISSFTPGGVYGEGDDDEEGYEDEEDEDDALLSSGEDDEDEEDFNAEERAAEALRRQRRQAAAERARLRNRLPPPFDPAAAPSSDVDELEEEDVEAVDVDSSLYASLLQKATFDFDGWWILWQTQEELEVCLSQSCGCSSCA